MLQTDTRANGQTKSMIDLWKQWEGQVADGKFRLRQYLGGTDRGPVFLTEYGEGGGARAAIKLYFADPQIADAQLGRWTQAASVAHPHVARILQTGRCQLGGMRVVYAVMEFADEDLAQVVPQRALTPAETREMLRPVLEALAYLHEKGLVHGHVKPSNIMAVGEQVKISSDGISAAREPVAAGRAKPTAYDAPEAGTRGVSAAGDVWSLGVTLVEVLTQKLPTWEWKGQEEPELPRMPAPFGDIAKQCLRRDPQRRCTLAEIATRLDPDAPPLLAKQPAAQAKAAAAVKPVVSSPQPMPAPVAKPAPAAAPVASAPRPAAKAAVADALRSAAPRKQTASPKPNYAIPAAAIAVVVLLSIFFVPRLLHRGSEASPDLTASASSRLESSQPAPTSQPAASESVSENAAPPENIAVANQPEPASAAAPVAAPAAKPVTKRAAAGGVGGSVVHQALPNVPSNASSTIHGTVRVGVRVQVDAAGKVTSADLESAGPSKYFANLAEKAARDWQFEPPTEDGQAAPSEWLLRFEFSADGAKATAARARQ